MLRITYTSFLKVPKLNYYELIRELRGATTIPIKFNKPQFEPDKKYEFSEAEFKKLRRQNRGIAFSYRCKVEAGLEITTDDPYSFGDVEYEAKDPRKKEREIFREEMANYRKKAFYKIKRLHFKPPKQPSMLTYIEKQQIKSLNKKDPDYWNCEKLSTCFPATPNVIKKVLKSKLIFYDIDSALEHDRKVRENWELFRKRKLEMDPELAEHLQQFLGRDLTQTDAKEIEKYLSPTPDFSLNLVKTEFGSIISTSKKNKEAKKKINANIDSPYTIDKIASEFRVIDEDRFSDCTKTHFTADKFRESMIKDKRNNHLKEVDSIILENTALKQLSSGKECELNVDSYSYLYDDNVLTNRNKKFESITLSNKESFIPARIHIPKALREKGKVYRVKDCFFNDQGYFIYRVPCLFS